MRSSTSIFSVGGIITLVGFAAWLTHCIVRVKAGAWGFLIAGALVFPIALVHGVGCWFGAW